MSSASAQQPPSRRPPDKHALFVALVLAPATFSRNRYFNLFEQEDLRHARRRAQLVRSIVKELTEPWPHPGKEPSIPGPEVVVEEVTDRGTSISYEVPEFDYKREAHLSALEASALHYALARAGRGEVSSVDRERVEQALARMDPIAARAD